MIVAQTEVLSQERKRHIDKDRKIYYNKEREPFTGAKNGGNFSKEQKE